MVKDQEFLKKKAAYCLDLANKLGATDSSVVVKNSVSETVNFRNKKLDESNRSDDLGISITTYIGKKKSSISSSNLLDDNLNILIEKCVETTKNTPEDEFNSLPDQDLLAKEVKDLDLYDDTHIENDQKIDYLKKLELAASNDKKIVNTESSFTQRKTNFILANSEGFCNGYKTSSFTASSVTVAKDEKSMERDYEYSSKCFLKDLDDAGELGKQAADQTIRKLSPKKIGSEKIPIIFDKRIAKVILSTFASAISSSSISRGTSFLKDKVNQKIFSDTIRTDGILIDNTAPIISSIYDVASSFTNQSIQFINLGSSPPIFLTDNNLFQEFSGPMTVEFWIKHSKSDFDSMIPIQGRRFYIMLSDMNTNNSGNINVQIDRGDGNYNSQMFNGEGADKLASISWWSFVITWHGTLVAHYSHTRTDAAQENCAQLKQCRNLRSHRECRFAIRQHLARTSRVERSRASKLPKQVHK